MVEAKNGVPGGNLERAHEGAKSTPAEVNELGPLPVELFDQPEEFEKRPQSPAHLEGAPARVTTFKTSNELALQPKENKDQPKEGGWSLLDKIVEGVQMLVGIFVWLKDAILAILRMMFKTKGDEKPEQKPETLKNDDEIQKFLQAIWALIVGVVGFITGTIAGVIGGVVSFVGNALSSIWTGVKSLWGGEKQANGEEEATEPGVAK